MLSNMFFFLNISKRRTTEKNRKKTIFFLNYKQEHKQHLIFLFHVIKKRANDKKKKQQLTKSYHILYSTKSLLADKEKNREIKGERERESGQRKMMEILRGRERERRG